MERSGLVPATSGEDSATSGSGRFVGLSGEESLNGGSSIISPTREYENSIRDKHAEGEALFRSMGKENLNVKEMLTGRVYIEPANALSWREEKGGTKMIQYARKMKTHVCIRLNLFSEMRDVVQSPMIQAIVKRLGLDKQSKAKYDMIWNIQQLFRYIESIEMKSGRELMRKAMALLVAFSATRMTELAAITRKSITQEEHDMKITTVIKKGQCCPVKALNEWLNDADCQKDKEVGIWRNYYRRKVLRSIGCSKELKRVIEDARVDYTFEGSSIRHSMMTRLKSEGASLQDVNDYTGYAPTGACVDIFYNKPIARDIGALLFKDIEL
ncbi:MAG: hypothetical protein EZS28_018628 [Streblomastix strix]|uniref:Tyr recombinase domain-containing protein n=1 Tax=Streblomastix strix TaxID=222440 RepID=A0A5J4VTF2_9EUKA|nr:MAG: hypothetical protein EZS28_018628 [Streblomastix strix]